MLIKMFALFVSAAMSATAAQAELRIDGQIDEAEWAQAQHVTDFVLTQPLSGAPSPYPTEAWILATPKGLAIAFRNTQPADVPRTRQRTQRDEDAPVDRVNLVVDFDGNGTTGYNFTINVTGGIQDEVVNNENVYNKDWDGNWQHAVSEDGDTWSAEMLIPWYIAPMKKGVDGKRTLGIYLDRVIGSTGERVAWPNASYLRARFLSDFSHVTVPAYSQALFAVTPYVVSVTDRVAGDTRFDTGIDLYWKPGGSFQLTATLNPDFGQVESDSLVVNFDAVETFFSDKRPFFTENQSMFDFQFDGGLVYTRRVGGEADDGSGAGDVTAAVKLNGSLAGIDYGVFAATEADPVGRDFYALRLTRDLGKHDIGMLATYVHHPFLDRDAAVLAFDHHWKPNAQWTVLTELVGSDISQHGQRVQDSGVQVNVDNEREHGWRQNLYFQHLGDQLQLNDFGYLYRNNLDYLSYSLNHRRTDLPKSSSYSSHDWGIFALSKTNDHGLHLGSSYQLRRSSETRNSGSELFAVTRRTSGFDDLLTRGHGNVRLPARLTGYYERDWGRHGRWGFYGNGRFGQNGLAGIGSSQWGYNLQPTFYFNSAVSAYAALDISHSPDRLLWREDNLLGTYRSREIDLSGGLQWSVGSQHELRVKVETIVLNAEFKQAWRVAPDGTPQPVDDAIPSFNLRNLGFQIRYRYELAPLSNVFVVYSRGGFAFDENGNRSVDGLLGDVFSLRDSEQFLVKLSYRFAN